MTEVPQLVQVRAVRDSATCLHSADAVAAALDRIAGEVAALLERENPLFLCVMTGGLMTASELALRCSFPLEIDYLQVSRYGRGTSGGTLEWRVKPTVPLAGRSVLVIDDILDEGHTLREILRWCRQAGAARVSSAVLVNKLHQRKCEADFHADFTALEAGDHYLFGYGMDYRGYLRNARGVYAVAEEFL